MSATDDDQDYQDDSTDIHDEEAVGNFEVWGYRGYKEVRSHMKGSVIEVSVSNAKGHIISGTGENREEAIETLIEQIDRYLDEI